MNVTFHGKRDFAGVVKVRLWIRKDYPEVHCDPRTLIRGRQYSKRKQCGDVLIPVFRG